MALFDMAIRQRPDGAYEAAVLESVVGETEAAPLALPYSVAEQRRLLDLLEKGQADEALLEQMGRATFEALFAGATGRAFSSAVGEARRRRTAVPVKLRLSPAWPDVARWPWELVHDGHRFLLSSGAATLTRYIAYPEAPTSLLTSFPLRILLVAPDPVDLAPLDLASSERAVLDGLTSLDSDFSVRVDKLFPPTLAALIEHLSTNVCHVIHFDGHGIYSKRCPRCRDFAGEEASNCGRCGEHLGLPRGYLCFEDEFGASDCIDSATIANALTSTEVRLVFLNACQTGSVGQASLFTSLGPALVEAGVPAVVGMQFSIPDAAAIRFARQFYLSIAAGRATVDDAVTHGRKQLFRDRSTWFIPVLYRRSKGDGRLFRYRRATGALLATAPPTSTPERPVGLHGVPQPRTFVGRTRELLLAARALGSVGGRLALWGPPGIGKSVLAAELVRRQCWRFPDGVVRINARGGKALDSVLLELVKHLGLGLESESPARRPGAVLEAFAGKRCLLVVDNYEDVEDDAKVVVFMEGIPAPTFVLITTSRSPRGRAWRKVKVWKMATPELVAAFQLEAARLGIADRFEEPTTVSAIQEICRLLDGLPLGVELVVGAAQSVPLPGLAARLRERPFEMLAAVVDASTGALSVEARSLVHRLAIFGRPVEESAIAAAAEQRDWQPLRDELVRHSVLHFDGRDYSLHSVVRQHLLNTMDEQARKRLHLTAAHYYAAEVPEAAKPHELMAENLLAMLEHIADAGEWGLFLKSGPEVARLVTRMGYWAETVAILQRAASVVEGEGDRRTQAALLRDIGTIEGFRSQWDDAISCLERGLKLAHELGDLGLAADINRAFGNVYIEQSKWLLAEPYLKSALENYRRVGDRASESSVLNSLGIVYQDWGRIDDAVGSYEQSLEISRELGMRAGEAAALANLGRLYSMQDRLDEAEQCLTQGLAVFRELGDRHAESIALSNLGDTYQQQGKFDVAIAHYEQSLALARKLRDVRGEGRTITNLANTLRLSGHPERAVPLYLSSLEKVRAARDRQGEGIALNGLGGAYRLLERWEEADACLRESLTIAEELGDRTTSSGALWNLGQLYVDRNDPHSAALLWARAVQILETFHPRAAQSFALQLHSLLREHNIVLAVFPIKVAAAQDEEANDKLRQ